MVIVSLLWLLPAFLIGFLGALIALLEAALLGDWGAFASCFITLSLYGVFITLAVTGWAMFGPVWYIAFSFLFSYAVSAVWAWIGYNAADKAVVREAYEKTIMVVQIGGIVVKEKAKELFTKLRDKLPKKSHEAPNTPPQKATPAAVAG